MRGSATVILANDIQYAIGLLNVQKGLGVEENDAEMNIIIDPTVGADNIEDDAESDIEFDRD